MDATSELDVERALWIQSAWAIEQTDVDRIMSVVRAYAAETSGVPVGVSQDELKRQTHDAFEAGSQQGEQRAREAHDGELAAVSREMYDRGMTRGRQEVAERPSERPNPLPEGLTPGECWQAPDGAVWQFLGAPQRLAFGDRHRPVAPSIPQQRTATTAGAVDTSTRACRVCGETKPLVEGFTRDKGGKDGRRNTCRSCEAAARIAKKQRDAAQVAS